MSEYGRQLNDVEVENLWARAHELDAAANVIAAAESVLPPRDAVRRRLGDARVQARFAASAVRSALAAHEVPPS
jgi:hypothetical protein